MRASSDKIGGVGYWLKKVEIQVVFQFPVRTLWG